jgi:hypothetical protein
VVFRVAGLEVGVLTANHHRSSFFARALTRWPGPGASVADRLRHASDAKSLNVPCSTKLPEITVARRLSINAPRTEKTLVMTSDAIIRRILRKQSKDYHVSPET